MPDYTMNFPVHCIWIGQVFVITVSFAPMAVDPFMVPRHLLFGFLWTAIGCYMLTLPQFHARW